MTPTTAADHDTRCAVLQFEVAGTLFLVPIEDVIEVVPVEAGAETITRGGAALPLVDAHRALGLEGSDSGSRSGSGSGSGSGSADAYRRRGVVLRTTSGARATSETIVLSVGRVVGTAMIDVDSVRPPPSRFAGRTSDVARGTVPVETGLAVLLDATTLIGEAVRSK